MCYMHSKTASPVWTPTMLPVCQCWEEKMMSPPTLSHLANWYHTTIPLWLLLCQSAESTNCKSACAPGHHSSMKQLWRNVYLQHNSSSPPCLAYWRAANGCYEHWGAGKRQVEGIHPTEKGWWIWEFRWGWWEVEVAWGMWRGARDHTNEGL